MTENGNSPAGHSKESSFHVWLGIQLAMVAAFLFGLTFFVPATMMPLGFLLIFLTVVVGGLAVLSLTRK